MKKEALIEKLEGNDLSREEKLALFNEFTSNKRARTPLQLEIDRINGLSRKYPEARPFATTLISKMKSEVEGRGVVPEDLLNRLRKAFEAMVASFEGKDA